MEAKKDQPIETDQELRDNFTGLTRIVLICSGIFIVGFGILFIRPLIDIATLSFLDVRNLIADLFSFTTLIVLYVLIYLFAKRILILKKIVHSAAKIETFHAFQAPVTFQKSSIKSLLYFDNTPNGETNKVELVAYPAQDLAFREIPSSVSGLDIKVFFAEDFQSFATHKEDLKVKANWKVLPVYIPEFKMFAIVHNKPIVINEFGETISE